MDGFLQSERALFELPTESKPRGRIDEFVFRRLRAQGLRPARPCTDAVFVRRVFLDLIGTLPSEDAVRAFLASKNQGKRRALVKRLLLRPEYADYQAMRWSALLRIKSEFPINLWPNAAQAYHRWIRESLARDMPYDRMAREMLTSSGSNFRVPPVNFYRALQRRDPETIARTVALTFMGMRADAWPKARLAGMAGFFARVGYKSTREWKEEIIFHDALRPAPEAVYPDGKVAKLEASRDPRAAFADWLVRPDNPWFAKSLVNRVWAMLLGRGIVHEADDMRSGNPPTHPDLLRWLARRFIEDGWSIKSLIERICDSAVYQASCLPHDANDSTRKVARLFGCYRIRPLEAEVMSDALDQVTGTAERYVSAIPEPYTFVPARQRSIALADASVTSPFLELFGRPPRDTGLLSERSERISAAQRLHLLNSSHVQNKLERGPWLRALTARGRSKGKLADRLYLRILSRFPTDEERARIERYGREHREGGLRNVAIDVAWALINSAAFTFRH